jgi:hypothetical protein
MIKCIMKNICEQTQKNVDAFMRENKECVYTIYSSTDVRYWF